MILTPSPALGRWGAGGPGPEPPPFTCLYVPPPVGTSHPSMASTSLRSEGRPWMSISGSPWW